MQIDLKQEFSKTWDEMWAANLLSRVTYGDFRGQTYYLTATDIARNTRERLEAAFWKAQPKLTAEQWRTQRPRKMVIKGVGRGGLLDAARNWLRAQERAGRLVSHNFGRGHISGQRYRPAGQPIAPSEQATRERKAKESTRTTPKPVHAPVRVGTRGAHPLCTYTSAKAKGRSLFGWRRGRGVRIADSGTPITCPRCLKAKSEGKQLPPLTLGE
jgi:hypothetical protein